MTSLIHKTVKLKRRGFQIDEYSIISDLFPYTYRFLDTISSRFKTKTYGTPLANGESDFWY